MFMKGFMQGLGNVILAVLVICLTPLLIWVRAGIAVYQDRREANLLRQALPSLVCAINTDCPLGFVCVRGYCVPEKS